MKSAFSTDLRHKNRIIDRPIWRMDVLQKRKSPRSEIKPTGKSWRNHGRVRLHALISPKGEMGAKKGRERGRRLYALLILSPGWRDTMNRGKLVKGFPGFRKSVPDKRGLYAPSSSISRKNFLFSLTLSRIKEDWITWMPSIWVSLSFMNWA